MRVAIVSDIVSGAIGGVERFTVSTSEELRKRGLKIDVYDRSVLEHWQERWYDRYFMYQRRNMQLGAAVWRQLTFNRSDTDVIIQNSVAGWNLRQKTGIPRIVIHHGSVRGLYHIQMAAAVSWRMKLNRYLGLIHLKGGVEQFTAQGAVSVAVSSAVAEELKRYYKGIDPVVIPNGIDVGHFAPQERKRCREKYGMSDDAFVVCFTARFGVLGKGFEEIRALAERAWQERLRFRFLIGTDEPPRGWPANVTFVKNVSYQDLPEFYSAADLFFFPSRYEGCSYSLLEAMACGLPILTTRVGYAKDLYRDVQALVPFILEKNDIDAYWKIMLSLVDKPDFLRALGDAGAEYVRQHNSLKAMVDSYIELIEKVAQKKKALS